MARSISRQSTRTAPEPDRNGIVDQIELRRYQTQIDEDFRDDVSLLDSTTPDTRDFVTFESNGKKRQTVAHGQKYVPRLLFVEIVADSDDDLSLHQYRRADSSFMYVKTNVPKGGTITLLLHPKA